MNEACNSMEHYIDRSKRLSWRDYADIVAVVLTGVLLVIGMML